MMEPAGTQFSEEPLEPGHCGTDSAGWLRTPHPMEINEITKGTACFSWKGDDCNWEYPVQIVNCGNYFVYNLETVTVCSLRYCSVTPGVTPSTPVPISTTSATSSSTASTTTVTTTTSQVIHLELRDLREISRTTDS